MRRQFKDDMSLRAALRELPPREPPAAVWERIQADLAAVAEPPAGYRPRRADVALAACIAVCATAALFVGFAYERLDDASMVTASSNEAVHEPVELAALVAESARLERTLVALPRYDGVVRVGTASTIAGLEDYIAWIDAEMSATEAFDVDPGYRQVLLQERVELMTALIDVQYAQLSATVLLQ